MATPTHNRLKPLYWLLISLMLAAQSVAHAHEISHLGDNEPGLCAVCTVSGGLAAAIPAPELCIGNVHSTLAPQPVPSAFISNPRLHITWARAPPVNP